MASDFRLRVASFGDAVLGCAVPAIAINAETLQIFAALGMLISAVAGEPIPACPLAQIEQALFILFCICEIR